MPDTHVVTNQVPPLLDYNPATAPVLAEALEREGGGWGADEVFALGEIAGSASAQRSVPARQTHGQLPMRGTSLVFELPPVSPHV